MAQVLAEKKVIFSGLWKSSPTRDVDRQLRIISEEFRAKPGLPASIRLTANGVELHIISDNGLAGKNKKVDINEIFDVIVNKYNPLCLMVVFGDHNGTYIFMVCLCERQVDGIDLSKAFRECKHKYVVKNDGNRHNWVLKPKQTMNNNEGESASLTSMEKAVCSNGDDASAVMIGDSNQESLATSIDSSGYHSVMIHDHNTRGIADQSQTIASGHSNNGHTDFDGESMVSIESYNSMKDELFTLSQEVRNIKLLLSNKGIDADSEDRSPYNVFNIDDVDRSFLNTSTASKPEISTHDRRVNFAVEESKGASRESGKSGMYAKRQNSQGVSHLKGSKVAIKPHFYRNSSSGASAGTPSPVHIGSNDVFEYPAPVASQGVGYVHQRKGSQSGIATSVVRPIERVYTLQPRQSHSTRRKIVIHPGQSSTLPAMRHAPDHDKPMAPLTHSTKRN